MISPERLRRYELFAGFDHDQLAQLAMVGQELKVSAGHTFFREGSLLRNLYFVESGEVGVALGVPDSRIEQDVRDHILGNFVLEKVTVTTVGPGDLFGWSAMIPPRKSTASTWAMTDCSVLTLDCQKLKSIFQKDCSFGYLMLLKVTGVIRQRLRDMHVRCLTFEPA